MKKTRIGRLAAGLIFSAWQALCFAQGSDVPIQSSFVTTVFGVQEGLPEQTVQALVQTRDGYLWVGTTGGLARFDGASFKLFSNANTPAFRTNGVYALLMAANGDLWIGTEGSGVLQYSAGSFKAFGPSEGLTDSFVRSLLEQSPGVLLIGTNNGFFRLQNNIVERLDGHDGLPAIAVNAMTLGRNGDLWIGGSRLFSHQNGEWKQWSLPGESSRNRVKSLLVTPDGAVWVGAVSGLYRSPDGKSPFERVPGYHGTVRALRLASDGTLWMSRVGQGGFGFKTLSSPPFLKPKVKLNNTVLAYLEDGEQDMWVGTETGLLRLTSTPMALIPLKNSRESEFGTVYRDTDDSLWAASMKLFKVTGDRAQTVSLPMLGNRGIRVRNVLHDRAGDLWFGTEAAGLWWGHDGHWRQFTTENGLANNFIRVLVEARDRSLWIGTDEGVSHWIHGKFVNYGLPDGLAYFSVRSMLEDRNGDVWIGTEQGLSRWHNGALVHDSVTQAMQHERVWAIHEDPDGGLWFGTRDDGLFHLRQGTLIHWTKTDGLANNAVYAIVEDSGGRFWMSGSQNVAMMRRADLEGQPQSHQPPPVSVYYPASGAETQIFGGIQGAGTQTADGAVWFPSNEGLIRIVPQLQRALPTPHMVIDRALVDGTEAPAGSKIVIDPGTSRLQISFSPLMLRSQSRMHFRYRLEDFEHEWTEAGGQRSAQYTNLPPGRYRFHVQGYEMDQPERVSEASLEVIQLPAFYVTWWFRVLCLVALLGSIFLLHRLRVHRLKQRFVAVLAERNRLAREMHDTLIQGCTSVSVALEATARSRASQSRPLEPLLELARTQIVTTLQESRAALRNLRGEEGEPTTPTPELEEQIERMCEKIASEFGVPVHCVRDGAPPLSTQSARHEVLMIVREAVHNAVLHAKPNEVRLSLGRTRRDWTIDIHDDGQGFDLDGAIKQQSGHFGVIGMRERAMRIGGQLSISSSPGSGTIVTIRVPLRRLLKEQRYG